jgi:hypothetical protein
MRAHDQGFEALLLTDELADGGTTHLRSADKDFNISESLTVINAEVRASILQIVL